MLIMMESFIPLGRLLGRLLDDHPQTIWAYSVNIAGSLVGTWLFVLLSVWYQPPVIWLSVVGIFLLPFLGRDRLVRHINLLLIIGTIILAAFAGREPGSMAVVWSPYQKLALYGGKPHELPVDDLYIKVNNCSFQYLADLNKSQPSLDPNRFPPEMQGLSQYDIPLLLHPNPQSFLVVGAGAGNDAAGGLRHGVKEITAVEIDPAIIAMGRTYHPENPYVSPAVKVINDDARSFFATSKDKYDVISFGLLDAHTTTALTNARLDHYVYTQESIARAKSLLADGGIITLNFAAKKLFIADRLARVLREVFQEEPFCFIIPGSNYGWGGGCLSPAIWPP